MSGLTEVTIKRRTVWAPGLMTIEVASESVPFTAGQFFNLGLKATVKIEAACSIEPGLELRPHEEIVRRSYSAASAPGAPLEFFLSEVQAGGLTPRVFELGEGDSILLDKTPLGFFTLKEVPEAKSLWMVATGTGLGPFVSMLREGAVLDRFEKIVVVHGVRSEQQLAYREELEELSARFPQFKYLGAVSGSSSETSPLAGRITTHFENGQLEERAESAFDRDAHMLLCGNPKMIEDMTALLKARGFEKHRRKQPGHFNFEKYW